MAKPKKRYKKGSPLLPLEGRPHINGRYHVKWASHGTIGVVIEIDNEKQTVKMRSPKTRIPWRCNVKWSDLRLTRAAQTKLEEEKRNG